MVIVGVGLGWGRWQAGHDWGGDFSAYIMQARAIIDGTIPEFLRENEFTIHHSIPAMGPVAYPWGFPLLLSPVYAVFGVDWNALKAVGLLSYAGFLIVLLYGWRQWLGVYQRLLLLGVFVFNPSLLRATDQILSDIPFLFLATCCLVVLGKKSEAYAGRFWWGRLLGLGCLMAFATLIRFTGVLLLGTYLISLLFSLIASSGKFNGASGLIAGLEAASLRSRIVYGALPVISFAVVMGWAAKLFPNETATQWGFFSSITWGTVIENLRYYSGVIGEFFSPTSRLGYVGSAFYLASLPVVGCGIHYHWKKTVVLWVFPVLLLILHVLWPFHGGVLRFWFPLLPSYVTYLILGAERLGKVLSFRGRNVGLLTIWGMVGLFLAASSAAALRNIAQGRVRGEGPTAPAAASMLEFIRTRTPPDAVVAFLKPRVVRLFTDRRTVFYATAESFEIFDYWVVDKREPGDQPTLAERQAMFEAHPAQLVFENERYLIYRFSRAPSTGTSSAHASFDASSDSSAQL